MWSKDFTSGYHEFEIDDKHVGDLHQIGSYAVDDGIQVFLPIFKRFFNDVSSILSGFTLLRIFQVRQGHVLYVNNPFSVLHYETFALLTDGFELDEVFVVFYIFPFYVHIAFVLRERDIGISVVFGGFVLRFDRVCPFRRLRLMFCMIKWSGIRPTVRVV
uniref:Uncharacterized protein n=1 Tax=Cacopsylla melanoneura TaxID=428564 RepID=A0A8D8UMX4_9HEMI